MRKKWQIQFDKVVVYVRLINLNGDRLKGHSLGHSNCYI